MTDKFLLGWVMDRSGSMANAAHDAVSGFNDLIKEQRGLPGELLVSLLMFDDQMRVPLVGCPVDKVPVMTLGNGEGVTFAPGGMTALLDATATMIRGVDAWLAKHPDWDGKVKIAVFTDGQENASRNTTRDELNRLIGEKQAAGWEFIFLGSGGSAWLEGASMSNLAASAYNVGVGGQAINASYLAASTALRGSRLSGGVQSMASTMGKTYDNSGADPNVVGAQAPSHITTSPSFPPSYMAVSPVDQLAGDEEPSKSAEDQLAGD